MIGTVVIAAAVAIGAIFVIGLLVGASVHRTITDEVRRRRDQDLLRSHHAVTVRRLRAAAGGEDFTLAG